MQRNTSGEGNMCLIHSIFPNSVDQYGGVYCGDAEQRLEAVKQYVLNRIDQLSKANNQNDLGALKLNDTEITVLYGFTNDLDNTNIVNTDLFYDDNITYDNQGNAINNKILNLAKVINNKNEFIKLLTYAKHGIQNIQAGAFNEGSLCYYIAQRYNIGIQMYSNYYDTTKKQYTNRLQKGILYNPNNSANIVTIHGQQGHFSAMLTDDEYNKLSKNSTPTWQPQINQPQFPKVPKTYIVNLNIPNLLGKKTPQINIKTMENFNDPDSEVEYTNIGRFYSAKQPNVNDISTQINNVFAKIANKIPDGKNKIALFKKIMQQIIEEKEKLTANPRIVGISEELSGENAGFTAWKKEFNTKLEAYNKKYKTKYDISDMQEISVSFQELSKGILDTAGGRYYENNGKEVQTGMRSYRAVQILSKLQSKSSQRA